MKSHEGSPQQSHRRGLTLVELIAATACVGLLFAIIQPSLQDTLGQSRHAVCLDRLRAIGEANLAYSADDLDGWAIPVHRLQFQQDPVSPTFIGAYEWGGKSGIGWEDWIEPIGPLGRRYGTKAGFGPATRPLNNILYRHGFRDNTVPAFNRFGASFDTQLKLDAYRCPADDGPPGGAHCPQWLEHPQRSSYDHFGTSYAANIFMTASAGGGEMRSNSPYLRPLSRVPNPARTLNYEENIGRWAWACRNELPDCEFVGRGVDPGPSRALRGWHGKNWSFNRTFVDAHAETQAIYIERTEDAEGYASHYRNPQLPAYPDWSCADGGQGPGSFDQYRCIIVRGDGWQKDTMPAPLICTGLLWSGGGGRPSYESCVSPSENTAGTVAEQGGMR